MTSQAQPSSSLTAGDRGPWSLLGAACPGGFSRWGLHLLAGWAAFVLGGSGFWALHLGSLTGWSSLPSYWGELLTSRDLWELLENGGLRGQWAGPWVPLVSGLALVWFLWAGWRLQAATIGLPARFGPWLWGLADALALAALPLGGAACLAALVLGWLGGSGIPWLGWLALVAGSLIRLALVSALFLQWWFCRLGRAGAGAGFRLGSWSRLAGHLGRSLVRFWRHPLQWGTLILGGAAARAGLSLAALALGWRLGGGSVPRVCAVVALQLAVVLVNAWLIGWFLRLAALCLQPDAVTAEAAAPDLDPGIGGA